LVEHEIAATQCCGRCIPATLRSRPFRIEFIHLTHSIIQSVDSPSPLLWKIIHTETSSLTHATDGQVSDLHTLADYGRKGVLALFSDSTNVERPG